MQAASLIHWSCGEEESDTNEMKGCDVVEAAESDGKVEDLYK